jgi:hypothetical protein
MANSSLVHSAFKNLDRKALAQGRIIHVGNLNNQATKQQFVDRLLELGFDSTTLYWADRPDPGSRLAKPYCQLQFEDLATAERAELVLDGADFRGRPMKVGTTHPVKRSSSSPPSLAMPSPSELPSVQVMMSRAFHSKGLSSCGPRSANCIASRFKPNLRVNRRHNRFAVLASAPFAYWQGP